MGLFGTRKTKRRIKDDGSVIVLDRVSKSYSTGAPALNGVNLRVKKGEFVFIVGDSGSGKSTLIKLLLRELTPTSGTILVNGQSVADLKPRQIPRYRRNLGIVFQDFRLLKDRNVYENVAFAGSSRYPQRKSNGMSRQFWQPWGLRGNIRQSRSSFPAGSSREWPWPGR